MITGTKLMSMYYHSHLPVWYLDAELGLSLLDRCWLVILRTLSQRWLDRWDGGDRMGSLGGTADPLLLPISCTNNMPHTSWVQPIPSSDRSSPTLQHLLNNRAHSSTTCVEQREPLACCDWKILCSPLWDVVFIRDVWHEYNWKKYLVNYQNMHRRVLFLSLKN